MDQATEIPAPMGTPDRAPSQSSPDGARGRRPDCPTETVVWFPLPIRADDIRDAMAHPVSYETDISGARRRVKRRAADQLGRVTVVNGHKVSIFRVGSLFLATEEACAHMGGHMSLGDIEDIGGVACIVCPSHGWSYDIITGQCVGRPDVQQKIYQIREGADGQLRIGFEKIAQSLFEDDDF